jgi:uncharacterized protein YjbJ (UPF0337 family)
MDWNMVEGNWEHYQQRVKGRWGRLTGDRLFSIGGKRAQLVEKIQDAYGISLAEAEQEVREFEARNSDYRPWTTSCSKWRRVALSTV